MDRKEMERADTLNNRQFFTYKNWLPANSWYNWLRTLLFCRECFVFFIPVLVGNYSHFVCNASWMWLSSDFEETTLPWFSVNLLHTSVLKNNFFSTCPLLFCCILFDIHYRCFRHDYLSRVILFVLFL